MLVYMNETWFWAVDKQRHNKKIISLEIQPIDHKTYHTSHINKVIGIVISGFLPVDNDIEKGRRIMKVGTYRAGRVMAAKEDSYTRIDVDDGKSYTYPKIAKNRLRVKGQLYFKNIEITGSKEGTERKNLRWLFYLTIGAFYFRGWRKWQRHWVRKVKKE